MKNYFKYYGVCWAFALVTFNVITFVTVGQTIGLDSVKPSFWIGYAFITLIYIGNIICSFFFFKEENRSKVFLNIPVIGISYSALAVSFIVGTIAIAIPAIPYWIGIIVDVIVLAFYIVVITKAIAAADIVDSIDRKVKTKTFFIKSLTVDSESLMATAHSDEMKEITKKVYEKVRYSDPMSNEALSSIEGQITIKFGQLQDAVQSDDLNLSQTLSNELIILLNDRNKKCMLLK